MLLKVKDEVEARSKWNDAKIEVKPTSIYAFNMFHSDIFKYSYILFRYCTVRYLVLTVC